MTREAHVIAGLSFLLLVTPLHILTATATESQPIGWWGPQGEDGWHARVPIVVTNPYGYNVHDHIVRAPLDVGALLRAAGWPTKQEGTRSVPIGFTLDPTSWRVVEYTNFQPPTNARDGQPRPFDPSRTGDDRYVVPSAFRLLTDASPAGAVYDDQLNPVGTLTWIVPGDLAPRESRYYMIYFDASENTPHTPVEHADEQTAAIEADGGIARGTTHFGIGTTVRVTALQSEATITVLTFSSATRTQPHVPPRNGPISNPFTLSPGVSASYVLGTALVPFVITSTAPVIAQAGESKFIPSADGMLAGTRFTFIAEQPSVYMIGYAGTTVQVTTSGVSNTQTLTPWALVNGLQIGRPVSLSLVSGEPFLVQNNGPRPLTQIPSVTGAPIGKLLMGASTQNTGHPGDAGMYSIIAHSGPADVRVTSEEASIQLVPRGTNTERMPPAKAIDQGSCLQGLFIAGDPLNPLAYTVDPGPRSGDIAVYAGNGRALSTPLTGPRALEFRTCIPGGYSVFAYSNSTKFILGRDGNDQTIILNALNRFDFEADEGFHISAEKPIAVLPRGRDLGFLPGRLETLPIVPLLPEVRGPAVALVSLDTRSDPILKAGTPGSTLTYRFSVKNLGHNGELNLRDTITVGIENATRPWNVTIEPTRSQLNTKESSTIAISIEIPGNDTLGQDMRFNVVARSGINPKVSSSLQAMLLTRTVYAADIAFEEYGGPKSLTLTMRPDETANITLAISNLGSAKDTFDLAVKPDSEEFGLNITQPSNFTSNVTLEAGATTNVTLRLKAPTTSQIPLATVSLDVVSRNSAVATDRAVLTLALREDGSINITIGPPIQFAAPGENATFEVSIANNGNLPTSLAFNLSATAPPAWPHPVLLHNGSAITEISRLPPARLGGSLNLTLAQPIPPLADAFQQARILFSVTQRDRDGQETPAGSLEVVALARRVLGFTMDTQGTIEMLPAVSHNMTVSIMNEGNSIENVTLLIAGLPPSWMRPVVDVPPIAPGQRVNVTLELIAPPQAEARALDVSLELRAAGQAPTSMPLRLVVTKTPDLNVNVPPLIVLAAGVDTTTSFTIRNEGNSNDPIQTTLTIPQGWQGQITNDRNALANETHVEPGTEQQLFLTIRPANDADASTSGDLLIGQGALELPIHLQFRILRHDLEISSVVTQPDKAALARGGSFFVAVAVTNEGELAADNVTLVLEGDGAVLDTVRIDQFPPHTTRIASFKAIQDPPPRSLRVVLDPAGQFPDLDEATRSIEFEIQSSSVPAFGLVFLILVLGAVAITRAVRR